jgi:hypothetical protein
MQSRSLWHILLQKPESPLGMGSHIPVLHSSPLFFKAHGMLVSKPLSLKMQYPVTVLSVAGMPWRTKGLHTSKGCLQSLSLWHFSSDELAGTGTHQDTNKSSPRKTVKLENIESPAHTHFTMALPRDVLEGQSESSLHTFEQNPGLKLALSSSRQYPVSHIFP